MNENTSITLVNYFDQFIQSTVREWRYKYTSEVIHPGLRLLEEEERKSIVLRNSIQEGLNSGIVENFKPKEHLKQLKSKRK